MRALGRAALLLAAQAAWLACATAVASELGVGLARFLAFLCGVVALVLAGSLRVPHHRSLVACGLGAVAGVALVPTLAWLVGAVAVAAPAGAIGPLPVVGMHGGALRVGDVFQFGAVGALAPVCEEVLFRRLLFDALRELWGVGPALVISSFGFGLWHGIGAEAWVAGAIGLLLGALRIVSAGIAVPIGAHAGLNVGLLLAGVPPDAHPLGVGASAASGSLALCLATAIARPEGSRG